MINMSKKEEKRELKKLFPPVSKETEIKKGKIYFFLELIKCNKSFYSYKHFTLTTELIV